MLRLLKRLSAPPSFPQDEEKTYAAAQLHTILVTMLLSTIAYTLVWPLIAQAMLIRVLFAFPLYPLFIGLIVLNRRGRTQLASTGLVTGLWLILLGISIVNGGVRAPAFSGNVVVVLCAGILLGRRPAIVFALASILSGLVLVYLEQAGWISSAAISTTALTMWAALAVYFIAAAALLQLAIRNIAAALNRAHVELAERQRAESTLRRSEEKFRQLLEAAPDAIVIVDADGHIVIVNHRAEVLFGYERQELYGKPIELLMPERFHLAHIEQRAKYMTQPSLLSLAGRKGLFGRRKDGREFPIETSVSPLESEEGALVTTIIHDITERQRVEASIKASDNRFRALIENSYDDVMLLDARGKVIYYSPSNTSITGYTSAELTGQNGLGLFHPDDRKRLLRDYIRTAQTPGGLNKGIYRIKHKDGSWRRVEGFAHNLLHEPSVAAIVVNTHDVTERQQAELLQDAVYRIAQAADNTQALIDLYPRIHQIISEVMTAKNFYIAIYDAEHDKLNFPYFRDEEDSSAMTTGISPARGLTAYVLRTGKSLLCTQDVHDELERQGEVKLLGSPSAIWLGVPLIVAAKTIGVMVVQDYSDSQAYGLREQRIMEFVSAQVATAIYRKQAEDALHQSEEQYRRLIEHSPYGIVVHVQGKVAYLNPTAVKLIGANHAAELIGRAATDFVHPDSRSAVLQRLQELNQGQEVPAFEEKFVRLDGRPIEVEVTAYPLLYQNQSAIQVVFHDITTRKRAEEALRASEERYRTLAEAAHDDIYVINRAGMVEYVNRFAASEFERLPEEIVGEKMATLFPPDAGQQQLHSIRHVFETRQPYYAENKSIFPRGEVWLGTWLSPLFDVSGEVRAVLGISRDITERKRAETERQALFEIVQAVAAMTELDDLFQTIHQSLTKVVHAENCLITLYDPADGLFHEVFVVDRFDTVALPQRLGKSCTAYVFRTGRPSLITPAIFQDLVQRGEVELIGTNSPAWLGVPLKTPTEVLGVLVVQHYEDEHAYNERDVEFLQSVGEHIALAIERKRAEAEIRRRADEFAALYATAGDLAVTSDLKTVLRTIVEHAAKLLGVSDSTIYIYDAAKNELEQAATVLSLIPDGTRYSVEQGASGQVVRTRQPVVIDDYRAWANRRPELQDIPFTTVVQVPMLYGGELIGALGVGEIDRPHHFNQDDMRILALLASQAASVIHNRRLLQETNQRAERLSILNRIAHAVNATLNLDEILEIVYQEVTRTLDCDAFLLALYDPAKSELEFRISTDQGIREPVQRRPVGPDLTGLIVASKQPILIRDYEREKEAYPPLRLYGTMQVPMSWLGVPMLVRGEMIGVIAVQSYRAQRYDTAERVLLSTIADNVAIAIEKARLYTTEQQRIQELGHALSQQRELDRMQREFIQNVSHELRTPLSLILGHAELLQDDLRVEAIPDMLESISVIARRARLLSRLVDQILRLLELDTRELRTEPIDLAAIVRAELNDFEGALRRAGLRLKAEVEDVPIMIGDPLGLRQVITNLIGNALKFTEAGGQISVKLHCQDKVNVLEISDTGIGIPPQHLDRIYDRFYQVDGSSTRKYGGVGLGLALVKSIVDLHQGRIEVESRANVGTTFRVWLPQKLSTDEGQMTPA